MYIKNNKGFSIIESVIVLLVISVLSVGLVDYFKYIFDLSSFTLQNNVQVSNAQLILDRTMEDFKNDSSQRYLPNSLRIINYSGNGIVGFEYVPIKSIGYYRIGGNTVVNSNSCPADTGASDNDVLSIGLADTCFQTITSQIYDSGNNSSTVNWLVLKNTNTDLTSNNFYYYIAGSVSNNKSKILTTTSTTSNGNTAIKYTFNSNTFSTENWKKQFYIASNPEAILCDSNSKIIYKVKNYSDGSSQNGFATYNASMFTYDANNANHQIISNGITSCSFKYNTVASHIGDNLEFSFRLTQTSNIKENLDIYRKISIKNLD